MRDSILDLTLTGALFFLLGLCTGISIIKGHFSIGDITGFIISGAAVFGVIKWRTEIDYKESKEDRKNLIKLIKKLDTESGRAMAEIGWPLSELADVSRGNKEHRSISKILISERIEHSRISVSNIKNLHSEIESEIPENRVIKDKRGLDEKIHALLIKNSSFLDIIEESYLILQGGWWDDQNCDTKTLKPLEILEKNVTEKYQSYFRHNLEVELKLGTLQSSLSKHSSAKRMGII